MAGNYDLLSTAERIKKIQNIADELNLCLKASKSVQRHFTRESANQNVFGWQALWDEIELKLDTARSHGSNALAQLTTLMTLDTIYPNFEFAYEWTIGRGGINTIDISEAAGTTTIQFFDLNGDPISCIPSSEVTADDQLVISGSSQVANAGIKDIASASATEIGILEVMTDETLTSGSVKIVRRTV